MHKRLPNGQPPGLDYDRQPDGASARGPQAEIRDPEREIEPDLPG
jgi:hypothetical protein